MSASSAYGTSAMVAPVAGLLTGWSEREAGLSQTPSIWNEMVPAVSVVIILRSLTGAIAIVPLNEAPEVGRLPSTRPRARPRPGLPRKRLPSALTSPRRRNLHALPLTGPPLPRRRGFSRAASRTRARAAGVAILDQLEVWKGPCRAHRR